MKPTKISHFHVYVQDRPKTVEWLEKVFDLVPVEEDHEMSMFRLGSVDIVVNDIEEDVPSVIAFVSSNVDQDYEDALARGALSKSKPADKPWGVRAAFVYGPGKLSFEFEQII